MNSNSSHLIRWRQPSQRLPIALANLRSPGMPRDPPTVLARDSRLVESSPCSQRPRAPWQTGESQFQQGTYEGPEQIKSQAQTLGTRTYSRS